MIVGIPPVQLFLYPKLGSVYPPQYFCFDFRMSKAELLDQVIHIRALAMGNMMISRLLPGDLIGEFRMDVRTVYNATGKP